MGKQRAKRSVMYAAEVLEARRLLSPILFVGPQYSTGAGALFDANFSLDNL